MNATGAMAQSSSGSSPARATTARSPSTIASRRADPGAELAATVYARAEAIVVTCGPAEEWLADDELLTSEWLLAAARSDCPTVRALVLNALEKRVLHLSRAAPRDGVAYAFAAEALCTRWPRPVQADTRGAAVLDALLPPDREVVTRRVAIAVLDACGSADAKLEVLAGDPDPAIARQARTAIEVIATRRDAAARIGAEAE